MSYSFDWKKTGLLNGIEEDEHQELIKKMLEECVTIFSEQFPNYVKGKEYDETSLTKEQQIFSHIFFAVVRRTYDLSPNEVLDVRELTEYTVDYIKENIESIHSLIEGAYMKMDAYVEITVMIVESYVAGKERCYCPCGSYEDCNCFLPVSEDEKW